MMKRWWEYQKALKPVRFLSVLVRLGLLLLNKGQASVKDIAINTTITIPLTPSAELTKFQYFKGCFPKKGSIGLYLSLLARIRRGKSQAI